MKSENLFREMGEKGFSRFEENLNKVREIPGFYCSDEEWDYLDRLYRETNRLKNHVISIGDAEVERLRMIADYSIKGNTICLDILKRRG